VKNYIPSRNINRKVTLFPRRICGKCWPFERNSV